METKRNINPPPQIAAPSMFTVHPPERVINPPPQIDAPSMFTVQSAKHNINLPSQIVAPSTFTVQPTEDPLLGHSTHRGHQLAEQYRKERIERMRHDERMKQLLETYEKSKKKLNRTEYGPFTEIGSGGFSTVFTTIKDKGKPTEKTLIFKQIKKTIPIEAQILKEVYILSYLQNICEKYVVCFLDFMEDDTYFYIVTEYLGTYVTLLDFSNVRKTPDPVTLITIIENLKAGLDFCHQHGVAHRDIKPNNIMIDPNTLSIKYIDFGLACLDELCFDKGGFGTPVYMSPEAVINQQQSPYYINCGHQHAVRPPLGLSEWIRADYWSLGVTIIQLFHSQIFMRFCCEYLFNVSLTDTDMDRLVDTFHALFDFSNLEPILIECCNHVFPNRSDVHEYLTLSVLPLISLSPQNRVMMVDQNRSLTNPSFIPIRLPSDPRF